MEKITFKTEIAAPAETVWNALFGVENYPKWTQVFSEGSSVETDWKKGSKAFFTDGTGNGMVSRIEESIPNQFLSIKHLGELKDGKEDLDKDYGDALENYTLKETGGKTELTVDMQVKAEWKQFLDDTWPTALEKLKELAESSDKAHVET